MIIITACNQTFFLFFFLQPVSSQPLKTQFFSEKQLEEQKQFIIQDYLKQRTQTESAAAHDLWLPECNRRHRTASTLLSFGW